MITGPPALEDVWPETAAAIGAMLRRRGVPATAIDDLVQETALRAIAGEVRYTDADDLLRWTQVVAWRLAIDRHRGMLRMADDPVADGPAMVDVAHEVETRATLEFVAGALRTLSSSDQAALVGPSVASADRTAAVRLAVRRHRARRRLLAIVESALAWLLGGFRRLARFGRRRPVLTAAAPVVALAWIVDLAVGPWTHTPAPRTAIPAVEVPALTRSAPAGLATANSGARSGVALSSPIARPGPARSTAVVWLKLPPAAGDPGEAGIREKQPADHFVCADTIVAGWQCVDLPIKITE